MAGRESTTEDWRNRLLKRASTAVVVVVVLLAIGVAGAASMIYWQGSWHWFGKRTPLSEWASFATFAGFVLQLLIAVATLATGYLVSVLFVRELDRQKQAEQQNRELIRLSEKMVDTEFYMKVMYPAWEVALKWLDPNLDDGSRYRADVVGGEFRLPKNYRRRDDDKSLAENKPRTHPHFQPYDQALSVGERLPVIGELSESLAFATWVRFWRNVKFQIDEKLVDRSRARHLFREWYMWWAPFMTEFLGVCDAVMERLAQVYGYQPDTGWDHSSIRKLKSLQSDDFGISEFCGHRNREAFDDRVATVLGEIIGYIIEEIEFDGNAHIDGSSNPARIDRALRAASLPPPETEIHGQYRVTYTPDGMTLPDWSRPVRLEIVTEKHRCVVEPSGGGGITISRGRFDESDFVGCDDRKAFVVTGLMGSMIRGTPVDALRRIVDPSNATVGVAMTRKEAEPFCIWRTGDGFEWGSEREMKRDPERGSSLKIGNIVD